MNYQIFRWKKGGKCSPRKKKCRAEKERVNPNRKRHKTIMSMIYSVLFLLSPSKHIYLLFLRKKEIGKDGKLERELLESPNGS